MDFASDPTNTGVGKKKYKKKGKKKKGSRNDFSSQGESTHHADTVYSQERNAQGYAPASINFANPI